MIMDFISFDTCDLESERRLMLNLSVRIIRSRNLSIMFAATGRYDSTSTLYVVDGHIHIYLLFNERTANIRQRVP